MKKDFDSFSVSFLNPGYRCQMSLHVIEDVDEREEELFLQIGGHKMTTNVVYCKSDYPVRSQLAWKYVTVDL